MCDCVRVCNKCKCEVVFDDDLVSKNYECACLVDDEDLDLWETDFVEKDEVKLFVSNDDKNHYKKYGCIREEKLDLID